MSQAESTSSQTARMLVDVGPVGVWIVVYNLARAFAGDQAIYIGTGAYMIAATIALVYAIRIEKRFPPMLIFTTVIVLGMGTIGILLQDPIFLYLKPTIINLFFSYLILISVALGQNVWKVFFGHVFNLPEAAWTMMAVRWAVWFQFLALINEVMWRHINDSIVPESARWFAEFSISESFWANAKLGVMALSLVFAMLQMPLLMKYQRAEGEADEAADKAK
ncbi:septation protein IspZ [uncultured Maricaulis sp.]|uniref:inner membrane-spanning protein YciB n=1 Tax=uncultured Maricaulis sp. TaxID=174710 RepID=UPI0030D938B1